MRKYLLLFFLVIYVNMCQDTFLVNNTQQGNLVKKYPKNIKEQESISIEKTVIIAPLKKLKKVSPPKTKLIKKASPKVPEKEKSLSKEELFEKIFGKKKKNIKNLMVPLIINQKFGRTVKLNILLDRQYVQGEELKDSLAQFLPEDLMQRIFQNDDSKEGLIDLTVLHKFSIESYFDEEKLAIYITVPPKIRKMTKVSFSRDKAVREKEFTEILKRPTVKFSGVSNFHLKDTFTNELNTTTLARNPAVLRNNTFINYKDYIFNTGFVFTEDDGQRPPVKKRLLNRDSTYISHDFPQSDQRLKVGDISLLGLDKMGSENILGVSFVKHHELTRRTQQSIRVTDKEIYLHNESQIEIFVNDRLIRTLTLQAGKHLLTDFPLINGFNHVKIKIKDIFGEEEIIDFDDFHYQEILNKGVSTYGLSAGIASQRDRQNSISYDNSNKIFSAHYNYGLSKEVTLNNGFQMDTKLYAYESELYWGSPYGLFSAYGVMSKTQEYGQGFKYGLLYRNIMGKTNFTLKRESTEAAYKSLDTDFLTNLASETFSAQLSTSLLKGSLLTLNYSEMDMLGRVNKRTALSYNYFLSSEWNFKLDVINSQTNNIDEDTARFTLRYTPRSSRVNFQHISEEVEQSDTQARYQRSELALVKSGRYGLDGAINHEESGNRSIKEGLRSRYSHEKYLMNLDYTQTKTAVGTANTSGSLGLSTAIAFVDNHYAFTQPIGNSFVLVENDDYFKASPLGIKNYNAEEPSQSFVIPSSDYVQKELSVEDRNLIFGVDLKKSHFKVASKYKSGTLVTIAPKFLQSAQAILQTADGEAVVMKVFKIFKRDDKGEISALEDNAIFFTNNEGKFILNGMEAGVFYAQEINSEEPRSFSFKIEDQAGKQTMINLGIIQLDPSDQGSKKKVKQLSKDKKEQFENLQVGIVSELKKEKLKSLSLTTKEFKLKRDGSALGLNKLKITDSATFIEDRYTKFNQLKVDTNYENKLSRVSCIKLFGFYFTSIQIKIPKINDNYPRTA